MGLRQTTVEREEVAERLPLLPIQICPGTQQRPGLPADEPARLGAVPKELSQHQSYHPSPHDSARLHIQRQDAFIWADRNLPVELKDGRHGRSAFDWAGVTRPASRAWRAGAQLHDLVGAA
jgi:hypothetical protein